MSAALRAEQTPYLRGLLRHCKSSPSLCLFLCTGFGKTILAQAFLSKTVGEVYTHALVLSPMEGTLGGFYNDLIGGVRISDQDRMSLESLKDYLSRDNLRRVVASCTNSTVSGTDALTWLRSEIARNPNFCRGKILVADEAHHVPADGLGAFVDAWLTAGGATLYLTATAERADRRPVTPVGAYVLHRTLSRQMAEGLAPSRILHELVDIGGGSTCDGNDDHIPLSSELAAQKIADMWQADGRPKSIIRIRNLGSSRENRRAVEVYRDAFLALGLCRSRIIDSTEDGDRDFLKRMRTEREAKDESESTIDVVIGIQRVAEGLDWRFCSHIYLLGIPKSLPVLSQMIGRATRLRRHISTGRWADTSKVVLVASGLADADEAHAKHALLVACFLADYDDSRKWSTLRELVNLAGSSGVQLEDSEGPDAPQASICDKPKLLRYWAALASYHGPDDSPITVRDVIEQVPFLMYKDRETYDGQSVGHRASGRLLTDLRQVALERCNADANEARKRYKELVSKALEGGSSVDSAHAVALESLAKEFSGEAAYGSGSSPIGFGMGGMMMERYAAVLKRAKLPPDGRKILESVYRYMELHGFVPTERQCLELGPFGRPVPGLGKCLIDPSKTYTDYHRLLKKSGVLDRTNEFSDGLWSFYEWLTEKDQDWVHDYRMAAECVLHLKSRADWSTDEVRSHVAATKNIPCFLRNHSALAVADIVGDETARLLGSSKCKKLARYSQELKAVTGAVSVAARSGGFQAVLELVSGQDHDAT